MEAPPGVTNNHDDPPHTWGLDGPALRLGTRLVRGLREDDARAVETAVRARGPFPTIDALWRASGARIASMRCLARADAFNSMGLNRREALWHVRALRDEPLPMFDAPEAASSAGRKRRIDTFPNDQSTPAHEDRPQPPPNNRINLPEEQPQAAVIADYASLGLSIKAHPVSFIRDQLRARGVVPSSHLQSPERSPTGRRVAVGGVVLVRQRPGTASGIVFMTLEDETGIANLVIRPDVYQRCRAAARHGVAVIARGRVEREGEVVHILVSSLEDITRASAGLESRSRDFH